MRAIIGVCALALSLAMLSGTAIAETYRIDHEVWGWYQQYLRNIGNGNRPGAFAITTDGQGAYYSWCQEIRCMAGPTYSHGAVSACEQHFETECVVFAVRDDIKVEYEIVGSAPSASNAADVAALTPAPVTRIIVPAAVRSEIEVYLSNAQLSGRFSALAIAKDGSAVGSATCPIVGSVSSGYCDYTLGDIQALVTREAVRRCGGAADCVLLYSGNIKAANIEIVDESGASIASAAAPATNAPAPAPAQSTVAPVVSAEPTPEPAAEPAPKPTAPPKPAIKLSVTPEVQEKIDVYLRNAQSSGRVWAFAIAKDGSDGAMASCATGSTYAGGRSCDPVLGSKEELAKREALARCGGPSACLMLYVGQQKQGNFEILVR